MDRYTFRHYLTGATAARTGDEMSGPALLLLGLSVTGSPALGSALLAGLTISSGVGGPVLGAILDRSPAPGRLLGLALVAYASGVAIVAALVGSVPAALAVAVAVLAGFAGPALIGGWTAQLPRVVAPAAVARGFSLDAATYSAAALAGPALAGLAAAALLADRTISVAIIAAGLFALCLRAPRGRRWPYLVGTLASGLVLFLFSPLVARYGGVVYWEGPEVPVIGQLDVTSEEVSE
ncbi:MAG TPA: hypothetical protein VK510_19200, partial [Solirubrobacteraceae bacterium]|nr:hypothetical protein [Solirubrobacteraceae bacterium]